MISAWVVVFTILVAVSLQLSYRTSQNNHDAICAQKSYLRHERDMSINFLREHPDGIVSKRFGEIIIPAAAIQDNINQFSLQLAALRKVDC